MLHTIRLILSMLKEYKYINCIKFPAIMTTDISSGCYQLTRRGHFEEVSIHCPVDLTQIVGCFQSVVAIIVVRWVFKKKATLQVVIVNIHILADVLIVGNLLRE